MGDVQPHIHVTTSQQALDKIQHTFTEKTLNKLRRAENLLNMITATCELPTANITVKSQRLTAPLPGQDQGQDASVTTSVQGVLGSQPGQHGQKK